MSKQNYKLPIGQRIYLLAILKGMFITSRHFFTNLLRPKSLPTIQYPEQRRNYSSRFRGLHVLTVKETGDVRCTSCFLCATACPADCIHITAAEHPDPRVEKFPQEFNIDMLRCVFWGMCEEACPVDAIRMGPNYELADFERSSFIYTKEDLMKNGNYALSTVKEPFERDPNTKIEFHSHH